MLTVVDRFEGKVIQKVTTPKGEILRYQTLPEKVEGWLADASLVTMHQSLNAARQHIGHAISKKVELTKPKMENPQNQKGYKASKK